LKSSFIELIRSVFGPKDERFRQRLSIFLVCLVISVIIWFSIKLANNYDSIIEMPVTFTNLPKNKVLVGISDSVLKVEIVEKGSDLFRIQYVQKPMKATISLRNISLHNNNGIYEGILILSSFISDLEHEHGLLGKIISVRPDTLYLIFESQKSRKIPVKATFDLTFEKQYMQYGPIAFEPDCVIVKGPVNMMEKLDSANLGLISYKELARNMLFDRRFPTDSTTHFMEFAPQIVKVSIPVEKYTESEMDADINIIHNQSLKIKTFPDKVKIFYKVALKDFSRIEPGMITAVADFSSVNFSEDTKVRIMIENYPDFIQVNKIEPEKAEFIIIK
jgi:hypothetical protein